MAHVKRRKAELGGIWPKAIKHCTLLLHILHLGKNEQDREGGRSGNERERERGGERKMEQSPTSTTLKSIVCGTSLG